METSLLSLPLPENERQVGEYIEKLTFQSPGEALAFVLEFLEAHRAEFSERGKSASVARCLMRYLLHKKSKEYLVPVLTENETLRKAVFGQLNTYKYSVVFMLKRLVKLNDSSLTREALSLLENNPFRDDTAKDYSDRWSFSFIIRETLSAPEDYLGLTEESRELINSFLQ